MKRSPLAQRIRDLLNQFPDVLILYTLFSTSALVELGTKRVFGLQDLQERCELGLVHRRES